MVITENTSLIRKLIDLKKEIDKPGVRQVATRFIKVQFADVTEIATTLTELLTAQQAAQKTAGIQRADAPAAPAPGGASRAAAARPARRCAAVARKPRSRSSRNPAPTASLPWAARSICSSWKAWSASSMSQTSDKTFLRRKLRFLTVSDFLPIAGDALTRAFSGTGEGGSAGGSRTGGAAAAGGRRRRQPHPIQQPHIVHRQQQRSSGSRTSGSGSSSFGGSSSGFGGSTGFGGSGGSGGMAAVAAAAAASAHPKSAPRPNRCLVGRTLLVADNITNSIVAQGPPSGLEIIERLLDQIDVKPDQVMISTVIGQLTLNDDKESGVELSVGATAMTSRAGGGGLPSDPEPIDRRWRPAPIHSPNVRPQLVMTGPAVSACMAKSAI